MKTEYDIELLKDLKDYISNGLIKIHDYTAQFVDDMEKNFRMGFNRIEWSDDNYLYYENLIENKDKNKVISNFLRKIAQNHPEILNETVVVIGDGVTNLGYEMKYSDFMKTNHYFFDLPQHTYVFFIASKRCINLTFEDELFFG